MYVQRRCSTVLADYLLFSQSCLSHILGPIIGEEFVFLRQEGSFVLFFLRIKAVRRHYNRHCNSARALAYTRYMLSSYLEGIYDRAGLYILSFPLLQRSGTSLHKASTQLRLRCTAL